MDPAQPMGVADSGVSPKGAPQKIKKIQICYLKWGPPQPLQSMNFRTTRATQRDESRSRGREGGEVWKGKVVCAERERSSREVEMSGVCRWNIL